LKIVLEAIDWRKRPSEKNASAIYKQVLTNTWNAIKLSGKEVVPLDAVSCKRLMLEK
jgi:hypothetical protein